MEKLEKVIAALECCLDSFDACPGCYLNDYDGCRDKLNLDALEVIRGLQAKYAAAVEAAAIAAELAAKYRAVDGDLIRRSDVLKYPLRRDTCDKKNANPHFINGVESVMEYVETLTAVEVEPVVQGEWEVVHGVLTPGGDPLLRCPRCRSRESEHLCGVECSIEWDFCPKCGAKLTGRRK